MLSICFQGSNELNFGIQDDDGEDHDLDLQKTTMAKNIMMIKDVKTEVKHGMMTVFSASQI